MVQVAATEFICLITSDAIEGVKSGNRVAIKQQDVMESLENFGFDEYVTVIESYLRRKQVPALKALDKTQHLKSRQNTQWKLVNKLLIMDATKQVVHTGKLGAYLK